MFKIKTNLLFKNSVKILSKSSNKSLFPNSIFSFSSIKEGEEEVIFETKDDKEIRYEDELFYFNKEWKKLQAEKIEKKQDYLSPHMSDYQLKECEILLDRIIKLNIIEKQYFTYMLKESLDKTIGCMPGSPNVFKRSDSPQIYINNDRLNPNHQSTQEILNILTPLIASGFLVGGNNMTATGSSVKDNSTTKKVEEKIVKEEEKKEKFRHDIQLTSFDPSKKITLIKEIRSLFNLGLKEAKEIVEKAPVIIKKDTPREEAEEIQKKLQENGGKIDLL